MGTPKRERQKAGRAARLEALQAQQRKQKARNTTKRAVIATVALVGIVAALVIFWPKSDKTTTATTATTVAPALSAPVSGAVTGGAPTTLAGAQMVGDTPCPKADGSDIRTTQFEKPPTNCIDPTKTYTATIETNKGTFKVALDAKKAPVTVNNFVVLARFHYYDGIVFHRVIPGFVVQGGDPTGKGTGGPGYKFNDELPQTGQYELGSLAMANSGPNTNGSQFFVITGQRGVQLSPNFSLFGKVTEGFDTTVKALEAAGSASGTTSEAIYMTKVTITES